LRSLSQWQQALLMEYVALSCIALKGVGWLNTLDTALS
jgi:hypothetical protein